jgi:hypothetical protein
MPLRARCSWPGGRGAGGWFSARCDLAIKLRWPGDDDCPGWLVTGDGETMQPVAGHEHEAARGRRPAIVVAKSGELAVEQVEHLVLAGVPMRVNRQSWRAGELHHAKLA